MASLLHTTLTVWFVALTLTRCAKSEWPTEEWTKHTANLQKYLFSDVDHGGPIPFMKLVNNVAVEAEDYNHTYAFFLYSHHMMIGAEGTIRTALIPAIDSIAPVYEMARAKTLQPPRDSAEMQPIKDFFHTVHAKFERLDWDTIAHNPENKPYNRNGFALSEHMLYAFAGCSDLTQMFVRQMLVAYEKIRARMNEHYTRLQSYNNALSMWGEVPESERLTLENEIIESCTYPAKQPNWPLGDPMGMILAQYELWATAPWVSNIHPRYWAGLPTWNTAISLAINHSHDEPERVGRGLGVWSLILAADLARAVFVRHACYGLRGGWNDSQAETTVAVDRNCHIYDDCCDAPNMCDKNKSCYEEEVAISCRRSCSTCKFRGTKCAKGGKCCDRLPECALLATRGQCMSYLHMCQLACNVCGSTSQQDLQNIASKISHTRNIVYSFCGPHNGEMWKRLKCG